MNKFITLLTCAALSACTTQGSEGPVPPVTIPIASSSAAEAPAVDEVTAALPEVRYYVISDG